MGARRALPCTLFPRCGTPPRPLWDTPSGPRAHPAQPQWPRPGRSRRCVAAGAGGCQRMVASVAVNGRGAAGVPATVAAWLRRVAAGRGGGGGGEAAVGGGVGGRSDCSGTGLRDSVSPPGARRPQRSSARRAPRRRGGRMRLLEGPERGAACGWRKPRLRGASRARQEAALAPAPLATAARRSCRPSR